MGPLARRTSVPLLILSFVAVSGFWATPAFAAPSIVLRLYDEQGCKLARAHVLVDGKLARDSVEEAPMSIEPGAHTIALEVARGALDPRVLTQKIDVSPQDEERVIEFYLGEPKTVCARDAAVDARPTRQRDPQSGPPESTPFPTDNRPMALAGSIFSGVGVLALVVSAGVGIAGLVQKGNLDPSCSCYYEELADARRKLYIADALLITSVVTLTIGLPLAIVGSLEPQSANPQSTAAITIGAGPDGAHADARISF